MKEVPMIAIVDDDEAIRRSLDNLFRSVGWQTYVFSSAQSFLDARTFSSVNCIICDVEMRGMTGLELQQRLIADGHNLPIIFITAYDSDAIRKLAMDNGATCYLPKPVDAATIIRCLNRVFDIDS